MSVVERRIRDGNEPVDGLQGVRVENDEEKYHHDLADNERRGLRPNVAPAKPY